MKKTALLSSILTIVLCLSIIAGSTFALFTDKTEVNIAVTSGNVEVVARLEVANVYSAKAAATPADPTGYDKYLIDEYDRYYTHEAKADNKTFTNGGTAVVGTDGKLVIDRITPGDKVVANIYIENTGDVAMMYRYIITAEDSKLAQGMVIEVDDHPYDSTTEYTSYEATHSYTSAWSGAVSSDDGEQVHQISFELPVYAGDEYQTETEDQNNANLEDGFRPTATHSVAYTIKVEAIQGNAANDDAFVFVPYVTEPSTENGAGESFGGEGTIFEEVIDDMLVIRDQRLYGNAQITFDRTFATVYVENVSADVDGAVMVARYNNTIVFSNCNITLDPGEMLVVADGVVVDTVLFTNVTINGTLITTSEQAMQYLQGVNLAMMY